MTEHRGGAEERRSVSSEVEVAVDPATAFVAFTEEMDLWWQRGPINFYDSSRAVARRCEPGVGGRLLEVYDEATGDALELGRFTVWEPGRRLGWSSSVDDVVTEVRFEPTAGGTLVRLDARVPVDGQDRGGTSWVRVTPGWFGGWCARRDGASREPKDLGRLGLAVYYAHPSAAARWLRDAFGFESPGALPDDDADGAPRWIEFHVANCSLMVFRQEDDASSPARTHVPWVFVDDLDAHLARAEAAGARIVEPIRRHGYRAYVADDLEGHRWTFAQARPTMA
jgi:uncharacterized glyoxalase superfamily protein PhnB